MPKLTFRDFLIEIDRGDFQLQHQHQEKVAGTVSDAKASGTFKQKISSESPSKGDVIKAETGTFIVTDMSIDGIQIKQAGGTKTATLSHETKFKQAGTAPSGKPIYIIEK